MQGCLVFLVLAADLGNGRGGTEEGLKAGDRSQKVSSPTHTQPCCMGPRQELCDLLWVLPFSELGCPLVQRATGCVLTGVGWGPVGGNGHQRGV